MTAVKAVHDAWMGEAFRGGPRFGPQAHAVRRPELHRRCDVCGELLPLSELVELGDDGIECFACAGP